MSVIVLSSLLMVGCQKAVDTGQEEDLVKQEEVVSALVIPKPDIVDVEDDRFNLGEVQQKLDEVNEGVRPDSYINAGDNEMLLGVPENFEINNEVYTLINAEDLRGGTHFVYVGKDSCSYCTLLRVHLDPIVEQLGIGMDYVDLEAGNNNEIMVNEFGVGSVPQIQVIHEGEIVAEFPKEGMYLKEGADYESLANGIGDLINVYLGYKHDIELGE